MSRTYRKSSITEDKSLVEYVNDELSWLYSHNHRYESYMTDHGQKAYEAAMAEWETQYYLWIQTGSYNTYPRPIEPLPFHFKKVKVVSKEIDFEKEIKESIEDYKSYSRDGRFYEGSTKKNYRKCCTKEIRTKNRVLCHKILKDDEMWDQQPFPDRHLGKKHIWGYW